MQVQQAQLPEIAKQLWDMHNQISVYTFSGPLGAGKTTLIGQLLEVAGVTSPVISPTFTYVRIYHVGEYTFYHFDLYRIHSLDDFYSLGFDEYLYAPRSWSCIEWPEIISPLLKERVCRVTLAPVTEDVRNLQITET